MILYALLAALVTGLVAVFFYRSAGFDIAGSIIAALAATGVLGLLIVITIYAGSFF